MLRTSDRQSTMSWGKSIELFLLPEYSLIMPLPATAQDVAMCAPPFTWNV